MSTSTRWTWPGCRPSPARSGSATGPTGSPRWVADMDFPTPPAGRRGAPPLRRHRRSRLPRLARPRLTAARPLRRAHGGPLRLVDRSRSTCARCATSSRASNGSCTSPRRSTRSLALHVPAYPPFLDTSSAMARPILPIPAERTASGWAFDHDRFAADLARPAAGAGPCCSATRRTRPATSSPRAELERLAGLAEEHDLLVISDEIHADLVYPPATPCPSPRSIRRSRRGRSR